MNRKAFPRWFMLGLFCASAQALPPAVTRTVCAVGCPYATVQSALDASRDGDIVELQAGATFSENVILVGKNNITIRTSRWRELPAAGYRIDPNSNLLATIQSPNVEPALDIGAGEQNFAYNGVDVVNDTITFEWANGYAQFSEGVEVSCTETAPAILPVPLVTGMRYFIRDWQPLGGGLYRARLSVGRSGARVDLQTVGSSTSPYYYSRPRCARYEQPTGIRVEGIRFAPGGPTAPRQLVMVGHNVEYDPKLGPNAEFRHVVITGRQNDSTGPLFCLALFGGGNHVVADSWIGHCKADRDESKGIAIHNTVGATITNNYIAAASINILTAGADAASRDVNKNLVVTGNFLEKPGYMMYKEGDGPPPATEECYYGGGSGAFYRDRTAATQTCPGGACYTCQPNNRWQADTAAYYRVADYLNKNLLELKDCEDCLVEGNYMRGSYGGPDSGQGWCYGVSVIITSPLTPTDTRKKHSSELPGGGSYHRAYNVAFRNNWADYCFSGLLMSHSNYGDAAFAQIPIKNVDVENNILTHMGWFPAMTQFSTPDTPTRFVLKQSTGAQDFRFVSNTTRAHRDYGRGLIYYEGNYPDKTLKDYKLDNNLLTYSDYAVVLDSSSWTCSPLGLFKWFPNDFKPHFESNVFYGRTPPDSFFLSPSCRPMVSANTAFEASDADIRFTSASDPRLAPSSPYSASNPAPRFLSVKGDIVKSGADVGADVRMVEQYTNAAQQGTPSAVKRLSLTVVPGSTTARIGFEQPENAACRVTVFDGQARTPATEHPDTNSPARKRFNRGSSMVSGSSVYFIAGSVQPLAPDRTYWYEVDCGAVTAVGQFRTNPF